MGDRFKPMSHHVPGNIELDAERLERNAIKLAELEKDWSALGPLRDITFSVWLANEQNARAFADAMRGDEFEISISPPKLKGFWRVDATRAMEPTAANVTYWERWFEAKIGSWASASDEGAAAKSHTWRYPHRVGPTINLNHSIMNGFGAANRAKVLFGETLCYDRLRLKKHVWCDNKEGGTKRFELVPSEFLHKARKGRPTAPEPTASKFAQWLYSLYSDTFGSAQDRKDGREAEEHILAGRCRAYTSADDSLLSSMFPEWVLVHNGMGLVNGNERSHFAIEELKVAGEALRVLPDLVYRNGRTGEIIIVEIKHSRMDIPENLWPNIWGQLWCYSQLPLARAAPKVTVIGEVWADEWSGRKRTAVCLRASVRRDPRAPSYDRFFRALFDIYRGDRRRRPVTIPLRRV